MSKSTHTVPFGQKVAFGMGMLANQMFPAALGIFMVVLVDGLGFSPILWGVLMFVPRLFDAITDPLMGFISDNTRSKWGRRRQYVFVGAVIMGLSYFFMWQVYEENGLDYNFWYFLFWSIIFYLGLTIFSVPYVAMGYEMSSDFHERTNIMAVAQWIGQWAWVIAPWFWVILYDPTWFENAAAGARTLSFWVGGVCMILAMIPAIFIKSESTLDNTDYEPITMNNLANSFSDIFEGFKEALSNVPFRKLCFATFLVFNSFNTIAAFSFFIIKFYLFDGDGGAMGYWATLHGSLGAICTTFLVIPLITWISKRQGKKKTFLISQSVSIIGYILFWFLFIPGKPELYLIALPFFAFGIGGLFTLMMSMTADVIDLDELNSGKRREGIFGAIYWWMVKFGTAFAGLFAGSIMAYVGFDQTAATQTAEAMTGMRIFYSFLPIAGTLLAIWVMSDYDLSEEKANEIRAKLEAKKS